MYILTINANYTSYSYIWIYKVTIAQQLLIYNIIYIYIYNIIHLLRLTQRASETMASAALALVALRLIMTAAVAIEAMIEMIRAHITMIANGLAELEATHYVLGPAVLTVPFSRAADLPLSHSVHFSAPTVAL